MSYGMDGWCKEISTQPYKGKLTDYIKREDAIKALCKSKCIPGVFCSDEYCVEVRGVFDDIPAADVIPIVRCKDCKHNLLPATSGNANCEIFYGMTDQDGFCHMAERRTDDQT